ncbi:MAG: hypothetical protein JKY48_13235 [Flavobacteriales bacterium]|nr:hypothetical protein [Flavobacteriales bacterium]
MKHSKLLLSLTAFFFLTGLSAQDDMQGYKSKVSEAYKLYEAKKYKESANTYAEGFALIGRKAYPNDRYNAACSYALAGEKDSALYHLYRLADGKSKYNNISHLTTDVDLKSLYQEKSWEEIVSYVRANKELAEKDLEKPLVTMLDSIHELDQKLRLKSRELMDEFGWKSDTVKNLWVTIQYQDSINELAITNLLDERGWLGSEVVGVKGNSTLFLVIQHAPIETQQKYLPMMRQAVKDGKARGSSLALLEDRVNLRTGKKQIYGSQIGTASDGAYYVQALEDPLNVDKRRASVGLGVLNSYTARWDFSFDTKEYIKNIKKYEDLLENMTTKKK